MRKRGWQLLMSSDGGCFLYALGLLLFSCHSDRDGASFPTPDEPTYEDYALPWPDSLDRKRYFDKVLGMLIGSAIGDALGAPTEMWDRQDIRDQYGYVGGFTMLDRPRSPEGPWGAQMQPGVTTDDTRWKHLMGTYFSDRKNLVDPVDPQHFAEYITNSFRREVRELSNAEMNAPSVAAELTHLAWLQEWAMVAGPFAVGDHKNYNIALHKFYGGEMACGGMLYTPAVGVVHPGNPTKAYLNSYDLALFDLGYARDISALCGAYVAAAMHPDNSVEEILKVTERIDPHHYGESRLIGRLAAQTAQWAHEIVQEAREIDGYSPNFPDSVPHEYTSSPLEYKQLLQVYADLDARSKAIAFHAGEIHLINLTALEWSQGDFVKAMEFVTNYGRDNDTVAAVTGAILGALHGRSGLPDEWTRMAEEVNREVLGIDLAALAERIVQAQFTTN